MIFLMEKGFLKRFSDDALKFDGCTSAPVVWACWSIFLEGFMMIMLRSHDTSCQMGKPVHISPLVIITSSRSGNFWRLRYLPLGITKYGSVPTQAANMAVNPLTEAIKNKIISHLHTDTINRAVCLWTREDHRLGCGRFNKLKIN